ncbi:MAG: WbqC family protein [Akkermansiaceae bacterium]|nr:WbqC family protein [Akkermansiaceae bacterium]
MRIAISQSNYVPWKGYFDMISRVDEFVLYDEVQFTRRDWRNRNRIKTAQGLTWLTIPVVNKGRYTQSISETEILEPGWSEKHWRTVRGAYARAAGFKGLSETLAEAYQNAAEIGRLSEVNEYFLRLICRLLGIGTKMTQSSEFDLADDRNERLLSICRQAGATTYLSGPAAKDYLDVDRFHEAGIEVEWMTYEGYPEYPQLHGPFEHAVSVLDLILNVGDDAPLFFKADS